MLIRPMQPEDADAVAELAAQLGYTRSPGEIIAWLDTAGASGSQAAFVAMEDALVVGWIDVCIERRLQSEPFALIGGLVVREGYKIVKTSVVFEKTLAP